MRLIDKARLRLRSLFRRSTVERELEAELRFHLGQLIEENIASGMTPDAARWAALRAIGGITRFQEECRDMRRINLIDGLWKDLRYAARMLFRRPGFTSLAVLTLALGIGATTAIFSLIYGVLLKPLPYPHPEELVAVRHIAPGLTGIEVYAAPSTYFVYREQSRTFQDIGLYRLGFNAAGFTVNITGLGEPERVRALGITDGLLPIVGVMPLLGRSFTRADDSPDSADTVMLTYGYWRRKFGGDCSVIGTTIDVNSTPHEIIGVLPHDFRFLDKTNLDVVLPMKLDRANTRLGGFGYGGIARLKPGVTLAQANADAARMLPIVERSFPPPQGYEDLFEVARYAPRLRQLRQDVVGDVDKLLWVLMGGISLVLIIACANVGNFLLVRAAGRQRELALRAALGASRGRIAASLFLESLALAVLGGLLGLGLAYGALRIVVAMAPAGLPRLNEIGVDGTVALFALAVSLAASLLFGSAPVFKYAGAGLGMGLREGGRSMSESRERQRSRGALVVVQVALALVLLVSSGLMIRTFVALTSVHPGFLAPSEVQTFATQVRLDDAERVVRMEEEILRELEAVPGVVSVGLSANLPMDGSGWADPVYVEDRPVSLGEIPIHRFEFTAPGFFETIGTPLTAGRDFTWSDTYTKAPVAIVSESFAREYWGDTSSAVGKQIRESVESDWREVIGVVGDVHQDGVDKEAPTSVYWPMLMARFQNDPDVWARRTVAFSIRSPRAGSEALMNEVRQAVWSVAPDLPLAQVHTLDYYYTRSMARTSFTLVALAIAGGMSLFLGTVGLYSVMAYSVSQRRREIGTRMALGAATSEVLTMVVRQGVRLALIGVAIGLAAALGLTHFLSALLYGVEPSDPPTLAAVSALLLAVAFVASYIPGRQAAKVDPMVALRHE